MIVLLDNRLIVQKAYEINFSSYGVKLDCFADTDLFEWLNTVGSDTLKSIDAFLIGQCDGQLVALSRELTKLGPPIIVMLDMARLDEVIGLFEAGVDDVIRKPMNVREILCRINACQKRRRNQAQQDTPLDFQVFCNGRDAIVGGRPLELPRRERRLLEYFAVNMRKRVTKAQIFNAIYGLFEDDICENVVESHVSKLRKKLRSRLGFDPIESKRYLGYQFDIPGVARINGHQDSYFDHQSIKNGNIKDFSAFRMKSAVLSITEH